MQKLRKVTATLLAAGMLTSVAAAGLGAAAQELGSVKLATISDIQYSAAHTDSEYVEGDLLIGRSAQLLDAAIADITASDADAVVVTGDLTADGTQASHNYVRDKLATIEAAGKQVYVIPGDKDVSESGVNAGAISKAAFQSTYADFGYTEAGANASGYSYMVSPKAGFNLIMLDTVAADGKGAVPAADLAWAQSAAAASGVALMASHFPSLTRGSVDHTLIGLVYTIAGLKNDQGEQIYTGNVEEDIAALNATSLKIADRTSFGYGDMQQLYQAGVRTVFSGHSLMNSVLTETETPEGATEPVETWSDYGTGALVSSGAAVRYTTVDAGGDVTGSVVSNITSVDGQDVQALALAAIRGNVDTFVADAVARLKVTVGRVLPIAKSVGEGFVDNMDVSGLASIIQGTIKSSIKSLLNNVLALLGNLSSYTITDELSLVIDDVVAGLRATTVDGSSVDDIIAGAIAQQRLDNTKVSPLLEGITAELKSDSETKPLTEAAIKDFASKVEGDRFYTLMNKILNQKLTILLQPHTVRELLTGPVKYLGVTVDLWQMLDDMITTNPDGTPVPPEYKPSALYRPLVNALILEPTSAAELKTAIADHSADIVDLVLVWGIQYVI